MNIVSNRLKRKVDVVVDEYQNTTGGGSLVVKDVVDTLLACKLRIRVITSGCDFSGSAFERRDGLEMNRICVRSKVPFLRDLRFGALAGGLVSGSRWVISTVALSNVQSVRNIQYFHLSHKRYNFVKRGLWRLSLRELFSGFWNWPMELIDRCRMNQADVIVAVSQRLRQELLDAGASEDKITVIPNGVNLSRFYPSTEGRTSLRNEMFGDAGGFVLMAVGRVVPVKGFQLLVKVVMDLRARNLDVRCVIIGEGYYRKVLEKDVRRSGMSEYIRFLGVIPNEELRKYYCMADATVISSYYESFGLSFLQSLACGCPVIASDVGDIKERCAGSALIYDPGDCVALTKCIRKVMTQNDFKKKLRAEGLELVKNYDSRKVYSKFLELF